MKYCGKTDIGKKRKNNQDSFAIFSGKNYLCAVVCDGMGGAKGGNIASSLAVKTFSLNIRNALSGKSLSAFTDDSFKQILSDAASKANSEIYSRSLSKQEDLDGMGTTLAAVLITDRKCFGINIGDSRIYTVKDNEIDQISTDHSFVQYLIDKGEITEKEAENHPNKNIILRAIGVNENVESDTYTIGDFDYILICSDGLTNHVGIEKIKDTIINNRESVSESLESKVDNLIFDANSNGGTDNITAVLIQK